MRFETLPDKPEEIESINKSPYSWWPEEGYYPLPKMEMNTPWVPPINTPVPEVPVPAAIWLFASAVLGLVAVSRRGKRT